MDWNAIEAISSAIGAVGVIVTIAYLAFQIRQNTHSVEGATQQSLMSFEKDVYALIIDNASVFRRGGKDISALNPDELIQFIYIVAADMSLLYSAYVQFQRKIIAVEVWEAYVRAQMEYFVQRGYWAAWTQIENGYPTGFTRLIREIKSDEGDGPD